MTDEKIKEVLIAVKEYIPSEKMPILKNKLKDADDNKLDNILLGKRHNPMLILLMSVLLGGVAVDRFMIGDIGLGVAKLLFGWLTFGIWWIIDIFLCYKKAKEINLNNILMEL